LAASILASCGLPDGDVAEPDLSAILSGTVLDEIEQSAGDPAAATPGPVRRPVACDILTADVAAELVGGEIDPEPKFHRNTTLGHTHQTQCDWGTVLMAGTSISVFITHYSLERETPEMTSRQALEFVRDKTPDEALQGVGNIAVIDNDRRVIVAGNRVSFHVDFFDGTGQLPSRSILETAARRVWASLEEYDS
jgi:hypothetical protein